VAWNTVVDDVAARG